MRDTDNFIFGEDPTRGFSTIGPLYGNEYSPETARREGYRRGRQEHNDFIIKHIRATYKRPSKQLHDLMENLHEIGVRLNDEQ